LRRWVTAIKKDSRKDGGFLGRKHRELQRTAHWRVKGGLRVGGAGRANSFTREKRKEVMIRLKPIGNLSKREGGDARL